MCSVLVRMAEVCVSEAEGENRTRLDSAFLIRGVSHSL